MAKIPLANYKTPDARFNQTPKLMHIDIADPLLPFHHGLSYILMHALPFLFLIPCTAETVACIFIQSLISHFQIVVAYTATATADREYQFELRSTVQLYSS